MAVQRSSQRALCFPMSEMVRVLAYVDGSVRVRIDGAPYVMEERFLSGGSNDHVIGKFARKLTPPAET